MSKPAFSDPDKSRLPVTPGVTALDIAAARLVPFRQPPERTGFDWLDEDSEEL
jgi:hypothetical protein